MADKIHDLEASLIQVIALNAHYRQALANIALDQVKSSKPGQDVQVYELRDYAIEALAFVLDHGWNRCKNPVDSVKNLNH